MFWASTWTSEPPSASTVAASAVKGAQSASSTPLPMGSRASRRCTYSRASAEVLYIFQLPAMYCRRASGIVERLHAGERLALEQLERRAAAGREVAHLAGEAKAHERGRGIAAADDRRAARARHRLRHRARARCERLYLEGAHRAVPEHGARARYLAAVGLRCLRADVEPHPAVRDVDAVELLALGVGREAVGDHEVDRQEQRCPRGARGLLERPPCELDAFLLDERVARRVTLRAEEAEAHRAADQKLVGQLEKATDQRDLVRHLRAAEHHGQRPLRILDEPLERRDLALEQRSGYRRQVLRHADGRGVRAVRRAERVEHER